MKRTAIFAVAFLLQTPALAQTAPTPAPLSESNKTIDGFSSNVLITSDANRMEKWSAPGTPHFTGTDRVQSGQKLFILTFFSNPKTLADGQAILSCDVRIARPDGSIASQQSNLPCFQGPLVGGPSNLYLSRAVIGFTARDEDQRGPWRVSIAIKDIVANLVLPLQTSFRVE